jgi:hypothetical protein
VPIPARPGDDATSFRSPRRSQRRRADKSKSTGLARQRRTRFVMTATKSPFRNRPANADDASEDAFSSLTTVRRFWRFPSARS